MDQVSRPLLGLLLAVVGLAGTWMVALRPHSETADNADAPLVAPAHTAPKTTAPGVKGLGRAVDHAKDAAAGSEKSNKRVAAAVAIHDAPAVGPQTAVTTKPAAPKATTPTKSAAPATTAAPAAPTTSLPAAKPTTQSGSALVNAALSRGDAVVLLFAGDGADDTVARRVVRQAEGPHVTTMVASIEDLNEYADVMANLDISAAPTIVVISPKRQATEIVGLPDFKQVQSALRTVA